jgi:hypothetical protein
VYSHLFLTLQVAIELKEYFIFISTHTEDILLYN